MCRLAAFPPNFPRQEAIEILQNFQQCNDDGTGVSYIKDGKFIVEKTEKSLEFVLKNEPDKFLAHMPFNDGWTIAHLRAASHGPCAMENTHPWVIDNKWSFIHNGIWSDYMLVKILLEKFGDEFEGQTDSEVAGHLWNYLGPKIFTQVVTWSGVFIGLKSDGDLWVSKTSGDLEISALEDERITLASRFPFSREKKRVDAVNGWYHFGADGKYIKHGEKSSTYHTRQHTPVIVKRSCLPAGNSNLELSTLREFHNSWEGGEGGWME